MARVDGCCCFSLKTGTLIIATLGWIGTLLKIFGLVAVASTQAYQPPAESDYQQNTQNNEYNAETLPYRIAYAVVSFIVCVLLVVGIYKKNSGFFIPYLVVSCLECIGLSIATVICFVFIFINIGPGSNLAFGIAFLFVAAFTALAWYLWTVVYSYYHEVKEETAGVPTAGNVYYSPTSTNPPPYNEKNQSQLA